MMELTFDVFWAHFEKQNKLKNEDWRKLHYLEEKKGFTLYLKSADYWEYFTFVSIKNIQDFGSQYQASPEKAIKDFKTNFLSGAMPVKSKIKVKKSISKQMDAGPEMVEDSKNYEDFLQKKFAQWEKAIFSFLDKTLEDELLKEVDYMEKSFGEFIRQLFNRVNTTTFLGGIKRVVKISFNVGVDKAEKELNMDIGFSDNLSADVSWYAERQLEGFYIDGKRWKGLKGVASDLQLEVSQIVRDGIVNRESMSDIKTQIKERLDITNNRATAIARTETTRFQNHGKLESYRKSGVVEFVKWEAFLDDKTSPVCKELHKHKPIPLGNAFSATFKSGKKEMSWEGLIPPAHPNCRSEVVPAEIDED